MHLIVSSCVLANANSFFVMCDVVSQEIQASLHLGSYLCTLAAQKFVYCSALLIVNRKPQKFMFLDDGGIRSQWDVTEKRELSGAKLNEICRAAGAWGFYG